MAPGFAWAFAAAIFAALFAHQYVAYESTVYVWDYWLYWDKASSLADAAHSGDWFRQVRHSAHADDYGPLPIVLPSLVMALFGGSRGVYVPAVAFGTVGAVAWAAGWAARRLGGGRLAAPVAALIALTSPLLWAPVLRGYPDLGGVALCLVVLGVYLGRPTGRLSWRTVILTGIALGLAALYRRWFSFFAVAFFLTAGLDALLASLRTRSRTPLVTLTMVGVWAFLTVVIGAPGWVGRAAGTDYAQAYTAYHSQEAFGTRATRTLDLAGPLGGVIVLISALILIANPRTRRAGLIVAGMLPVMLVHFLRVQDFGPHHCYLFLPAYLLLPTIALGRLLTPRPVWITIPTLLALTPVSATTVAALIGPPNWQAALRPAVADYNARPLTRSDLPELRRLLRAVDAAGGTATVAASSQTLTSSLLLSVNASLGEVILDRDRITLAEEVDRVGGYPKKLLAADVVVIATPTPTHLRPEEQQGVIQFAQAVRDARGIGAAYEKLPGDYHLEGGVVANIYRRTRPFTPAEMTAFTDGLRQAHPDEPRFYLTPQD